ncbi:aldehyde dehydrogenase [Mycolicibacter heraklionensis]|uniref:Aldehyde dehydrogenase n=1 Tax=Mycolicibacter heraklionensis TaxID=512402 RepID=A0A9X7ZF76_9MYCO|nr:aldehyde dehydrogenase [Mycolicibacter heraklionensis]QZA06470.1 aldehyde dehydrogenase [Mycolicibacter heraklionensis]
MTGPLTPLLIDGALVAGGGGAFPTINPATEEPLGAAADGDAADLDRAIDAARTAFDSSDWGRDTALRVHCLRQLRDVLNDEIETLREITIAEVGAPRSLTYRGQLQTPVDDLGFPAATAESYPWQADLGVAAPMGITTARTLVREPFGVVGAITPWNFPHQVTFAKIGPALAAGNTVVLKPAPDTPWCAAEVGRIIAEKTDFPPGVVNIVTASDHRIGARLAEDVRVDVVSFTGSTATGRSVMTAAAQTIKKVFLELGGKSAFVVLDDADLPAACTAAAATVSMHAGQGCALTTRLLVPRERYREALDAVAAAMSQIAVGDPNDPKTLCGPLISAKQRDRVQSYLDLAIAEGGTFHCGGGRPAGLDRGFFIEPTAIAGLTNDARVAREEIFGPVLVVLAHDGDADALRIANDSPYGLSATVFGSDERAARMASRLRAGTVNVNGGMWYSADVPFGGYKQSGVGREMGLAGFEEYLETKVVATAVTGTER